LFARSKLFKHIKEKYGQDTLRGVRAYERLCKRHEKASCDLKFLLTCKIEKLCPKFAQPNLSIKTSYKVKEKIGKVIVEAEILNKHNAKKELKRKMKEAYTEIQKQVGFLVSQAIKYRIRSMLGKEKTKWISTQNKKLSKLREERSPRNERIEPAFVKRIIHNFSSYILSPIEEEALARGLGDYIPGEFDKRRIEVEFELFYENILRHTKDLTGSDKTILKSKFLNAFRNYSDIKESYKYKDVISELAKNKNICLLKQDKGKGIVIMDKIKYQEKCEAFLDNDKFDKIEGDPTASFETKVQNLLLSIKHRFNSSTYNKLYPTGSRPGMFYGTAKVHKLKDNSTNVEDLPIRPIVSSIGTATYETSKYLANLLAPLAKSKYTVDSTKEFVERMKEKSIDEEFELVSFDVTSLFTNVPLDYTIKVILDKIYKEKRIKTKLKRDELKALLNICTKEMHFALNSKIYKQNDGVCMGNPLGPVIANIFMVELETILIPTLTDKIPEWVRYVDDTFTFVKIGELHSVLRILNSFHTDIKFTCEREKNRSISFLDVKITRKGDGTFTRTVYRKETSSNIYINWNSFAPRTWKIGTLHGLIQRAFVVCSEPEGVEKELTFLKTIFSKVNGYPVKVIQNTVDKVKQKMQEKVAENVAPIQNDANSITKNEIIYRPHMCLPYGGNKGNALMKKFKGSLKRILPENVQPDITVRGKKVGSFFPLKDKAEEKHTSGFVYEYKCSRKKCKGSYIGETGRRKEKRVHEHGHTDKKSAVLQHTKKTKHAKASEKHINILARNYPQWRRRKICEAMFIRDKIPLLNKQKDSYKLSLFT